MKPSGKTALRIIISVLSILLLIFIDQWTKQLVISRIKDVGLVPVIDRVFYFGYLENTGAAFGMMKNMSWVFYIIAPVISIVLFVIITKLPGEKRYLPLMIDFIFIISGALGNLIDRIFRGFVVDFIYFQPINFPYFNVADCYITIGFAALLIMLVFVYKEGELDFLN